MYRRFFCFGMGARMKTDFEIIEHRFDKPIRIYPIADVHLGSIYHRQKEWERFVKELEADEGAYIFLNGDLVNNNIKNAPGSVYEDRIRPMEQKRMMVEYLMPIRDKILCLTSGNHERRSLRETDQDITADIATKLDIEPLYRENAAFVKICIGNRSSGKRICPLQTYVFCVTHGSGGGAYPGGVINKNERFATGAMEGVDCLVVGHTHKGQISRPSKLIVDKNSNAIFLRDMLVLSCVSWQQYGGYAMQKMLQPSATANPQILTLEERKHNISVLW